MDIRMSFGCPPLWLISDMCGATTDAAMGQPRLRAFEESAFAGGKLGLMQVLRARRKRLVASGNL